MGSAIVNNQLKYMREKDLGLDTRNIITTEARFRDYQSAKSVFMSNPDIISMTLSDPPNIDQRGFSEVSWEGKNPESEIQFFPVNVDPDYLKTFGVKMAEGRFFSDDIPTDRTESLVLNETAVRAMNIGSPFGKKMTIVGQAYYVIGVIKDFHHSTSTEANRTNDTNRRCPFNTIHYVYKSIRPGQQKLFRSLNRP